MRANTRTVVCSLALSLLLALPTVALGQQRAVGTLVSEINEALAGNPSPSGTFRLDIDSTGKLVAEKRDATGVIARWEMYFEDIATVAQSSAGHVYVECSDEFGNCVKETCNGAYANFMGCVRGSGSAQRRTDALVLEYGYDTRAMRSLKGAFEELLMHDLGM
jgi:hypothetical protein